MSSIEKNLIKLMRMNKEKKEEETMTNEIYSYEDARGCTLDYN